MTASYTGRMSGTAIALAQLALPITSTLMVRPVAQSSTLLLLALLLYQLVRLLYDPRRPARSTLASTLDLNLVLIGLNIGLFVASTLPHQPTTAAIIAWPLVIVLRDLWSMKKYASSVH